MSVLYTDEERAAACGRLGGWRELSGLAGASLGSLRDCIADDRLAAVLDFDVVAALGDLVVLDRARGMGGRKSLSRGARSTELRGRADPLGGRSVSRFDRCGSGLEGYNSRTG